MVIISYYFICIVRHHLDTSFGYIIHNPQWFYIGISYLKILQCWPWEHWLQQPFNAYSWNFKEQVGFWSYKICQSGFFLDGRKQQFAFSETMRLPTGRFAISCFMTFGIHCCKRANTKTSLVIASLRAQLRLFQDLLLSTRIRKFYIVHKIGFYWIGKFANNYKYYMDRRSL